MEIELAPSAANKIKPLDIVDCYGRISFNYAIDTLEKQVMHYLDVCGSQGKLIDKSFLHSLFYQMKLAGRK